MTQRKSAKRREPPKNRARARRQATETLKKPPEDVFTDAVQDAIKRKRTWDDKGFDAYDQWRLADKERWPPSLTLIFRKAAWIEAYIYFGTKSAAHRSVSTRDSWLRKQIKEDAAFAASVASAQEVIVDDLEEEAQHRAKEGSDQLLMFLLKRYRAEFKDEAPLVNVYIESARDKVRDRLTIIGRRKALSHSGMDGNGSSSN